MKFSRKDFGIAGPNDCMQSEKCKDKYLEYQKQYREEIGVYPELDKKNNPLTALWDETYIVYRDIMKRGFWGDLCYHDVHALINKRVKQSYHKYKKEWSFMISIGLDRSDFVTSISEMEPTENINNDLGVRVDENGNYYEGTWENGALKYGFIYFKSCDMYFVGSINKNRSNETTYDGMRFCVRNIKAKNSEFYHSFGTFFFKKDELIPFEGLNMQIVDTIGNELIERVCTVGHYDCGYAHGLFRGKIITANNRQIFVSKYKDGALKRSAGNLFMVLHFFLMFYVFFYFLYKYFVFWPFVALYRYSQKRNWK